jgi:hypothetical protein
MFLKKISYFSCLAALLGASVQVLACGGSSTVPEIIGSCPTVEVSSWPECDRSIPVTKIEGNFFYWDEFFAERDVACKSEFLRMPATIEVMKDLQACLNLPCDQTAGASCYHDVVVQPYFYDTQNTAKVLASQESCGRRGFEAKGCFVKGTHGRVFVAHYIGAKVQREKP